MTKIYVITILTVAVMALFYLFYLAPDEKKKTDGLKKTWIQKWMPLIALFIVGFIFKSYCTSFMHGHNTDVGCFTAWSSMVYENGISKFYYLDGFTDYPPGFMYVLYVVAWLRGIFHIDAYADSGVYLIKLVPMLSDMIAAFLIYKLAKKRFSEGASLVVSAAYIFNPTIILNSSVWCQVDGIFAMLTLATCYLCMEKKRIPAYFVFALGILVKPQMLIFTPVIIFTIIEQVFLTEFSWKKFWTDLGCGLLAIGMLFLLALPFGLEKVIPQYVETLGSYPYATINAYNFWELLGQCWRPQEDLFLGMSMDKWGQLAIILAVVFGALVFFKAKKEDESKYFTSMATIVGIVFAFSVRMHERYLFPAIVLLLAGYAVSKKKEIFFTFIGITITQFVNTAHVLIFNVELDSTWTTGKIVDFTAIAMITVLVYFIYECLKKEKDEEVNPQEEKKKISKLLSGGNKVERLKISPSKVFSKMTKKDYIIMVVIIAVYSAFALYDLGNNYAPETHYDIKKDNREIVFDLGEAKNIKQVFCFLGNYENRTFQLSMGNDLNAMEQIGQITYTSVFKWNKSEGYNNENSSAKNARYIKLVSDYDDCCVLNEFVITDTEDNIITPVNTSDYPALFDEQSMFEKEITFRNGTYFDEIYHARTAYEMIHGLYNYENTHPPLGKFFISLGVRVFGMNPFGWRIVGVLFGIFMLPFMYMFGKKMFDKTWVAALTMTLFAFDFMHFTQTRISTIDVYGTFFIIAMYYFMYVYSQMSFYDTELKKTFIPLALSGVSMGLGIASKWTAVYAGAGLGVIFFAIMAKRYMEYRYACNKPKAVTGEIPHKRVKELFSKNLIKTCAACVLFFVLIPGTIYLLAYIPFSDGTGDNLFMQMLHNQQQMFRYHSELVAEHPYSSAWYEWPTMIRPMFYYSNTLANGLKEGISAFGNPLVWWAGIPALLYMFYKIFAKKDTNALYITVAYFAQLLPWILVPRLTFAYHYFPSAVFVTIMVIYCLRDFVGEKNSRIKYAVLYVVVAFLFFIMFYPVISGMPINGEYVTTSLKWQGLKLFGDEIIKFNWVFTI